MDNEGLYLNQVSERRDDVENIAEFTDVKLIINGVTMSGPLVSGKIVHTQTFATLYNNMTYKDVGEPRLVWEETTLHLTVPGLATIVSKASRP